MWLGIIFGLIVGLSLGSFAAAVVFAGSGGNPIVKVGLGHFVHLPPRRATADGAMAAGQ